MAKQEKKALLSPNGETGLTLMATSALSYWLPILAPVSQNAACAFGQCLVSLGVQKQGLY